MRLVNIFDGDHNLGNEIADPGYVILLEIVPGQVLVLRVDVVDARN